MTDTPVLDIRGVGKAFPNVRALSNLSFDVRRGEVMAFVGENGAGKSTLLKILSGDYQLDEGSVLLDGQEVSHASPLAARRAGFRLVRQEPEIVPHVSAAENIFVGELPQRGGVVDFRQLRADARALLVECGFDGLLDLDAQGDSFSPAQRHIVEIARALATQPKLLLLDEPAAGLTSGEKEELIGLIGRIRDERDLCDPPPA